MVDGTIRNFCSLVCVTTFRVQRLFILVLFYCEAHCLSFYLSE